MTFCAEPLVGGFAQEVARWCKLPFGKSVLSSPKGSGERLVYSSVRGEPVEPRLGMRGIFKKCVNSQAVYLLSEQHGIEAQERR